MTPADILRAAAERLRELADAAPEPPWTEDGVGDIGFGVSMGGGRGVDTGDDGPDGRALAQHIAAMHPGLARALADWLASWTGIEVAEDGPLAEELRHALAVARQILGSTA